MINQQLLDTSTFDLELEDNADLRKKVGQRLGQIRRELKMSQETVATAVGMSRPHLSNVELGRSRTGWNHLRRVAEQYRKDIARLADEVKEMPEQPAVAPIARVKVEDTAMDLNERLLLAAWRCLVREQQQEVLAQILDLARSRFAARS